MLNLPVSAGSSPSEPSNGLPTKGREDLFQSVAFLPPASVRLIFRDQFSSILPVETLELPLEELDWPGIAVSLSGSHLILRAHTGEEVLVEAETLRSLCDPDYNRKLRSLLASLTISNASLEGYSRNFQEPPQLAHREEPCPF